MYMWIYIKDEAYQWLIYVATFGQLEDKHRGGVHMGGWEECEQRG